jgi:putative MATE family efflux protein
MNKAEESFATGPVSLAVLRNVVPAILAMMMVLIYNLADTFFIGQTHNDFMVAAVSLATPVFMIFMSVGTLFGMGGTSVISRALGEKDVEYAKKVCSFCMWACVGVGLIVSVLLWVFMDPLLKVMGASADTFSYTKSYLNIVTICGVFSMISNCYGNIIRAEGNSTMAMSGLLVGNLLNVILDPIMIIKLNWGVQGAAWATVIGNFVAAMIYLAYYWTGHSPLSISPKYFSMKEKIASGVISIGFPASLGNLLMSISQMITNSLMATYNDMAVAAYGVSAKIMMIVTLVGIGIGQGIQPLLGYCYGAKNRKRFNESIRFSMIFALVCCAVVIVLCIANVETLVQIFLTNPDALEYGIHFSRIMMTTGWLFGVYYVLMNVMQALGKAIPALIVSVCRQGAVYIPAVFILESIMGMDGLVWAQPCADIISLVLAFFLFIWSVKHSNWKANKLAPESSE